MCAVVALCLACLVTARADPAEPVQLEDCRISAGPGFPGIKARCGILLRPLDPAARNSPHIDLHVAVVPALSLEPQPDAFVPIAGGPGQASSDFYAAYAGAFEDIRRSRDIVLLDQRGTGESAALDCDLGDDFLRAEPSTEETLAATRDCLDALPYDPRFFTTSVAVRDLEALREALGYTQFNLYGVSYGTRVAQHYLRRYPAATRSVILDGVVPPQRLLGPDIAVEAQRALDAIFARCAADEACRARFPRLRDSFRGLYARLGSSPVTVELPHPRSGHATTLTLGRAELAGAIRLMSYHPNTVALLPLLLQTAADGNFVPLAAQYLMATDAVGDALSLGMHNAVMCTEDVPFFDDADIDEDALRQTYIGPMLVRTMRTVCSLWPAGVRDADLGVPLATDKPVLLLSGDADPITPPAYAEQAAVDLANAAHLVGHGQGHGMAARGCVPDIMADFVARAAIDGLDTDCLARQYAMPFFLDFSGPAP
ncbi:MAG TPA: alpha/beta fold hydrolase [Woeseiaceae bacterium]|nr:alpha/beta fold hydrolase [Woeseiaceae bacterium]